MTVGDINSNERGTGARYNDGKPEYSQIPLHLLEDTARVFMHGEKKYAKFNWMKGMKWSIPYDCLQRHMIAWYKGEDIDPESGLPHLAHAMCNLLMLTLYADSFPEGDDRPKEFFDIPKMVEVGVTSIVGESAVEYWKRRLAEEQFEAFKKIGEEENV